MTPLLRRLSAAVAALLTLGTFAPAMAQAPSSTQENIELFVGDIFEILPSHSLENATYTWILTQDRTFIEAGRAPTFRKRLITPGVYTLYAEISGGNQNLSRTFTLDYRARTPGQQPVTGSGGANSLVRTSPPMDEQGRVVLAEGSQLLTLDPANPDIRPVIADLDLNRDTDGDGDPANDIDTDQTFFQTDATPLHVWIAEPFTSRTMAVTIARPDGAQQQRLEIYDAAYAREQGISRATTSVTIEETDTRTYEFGAAFPTGVSPQTPLLYHWEFGDGQQSLLANPVHEYASDGTYEVKLRIRDLTTGREIAMYTENLTVEAGPGAVPAQEEPVDEEPATNGNASGIGIGSILLLAGVFIASLLFGIGIILLLSKLRGRGKSFSDTIEKMEQTIVKKDDKSGNPPTLTIAPPAPNAKQTPPPEIAQREKENASVNPARQTTPTVDEKNAPSWLKSGLAAQPAAPQQSPQTPRPQTPPPAATPQAPAPVQQPNSQTPPATTPAQSVRLRNAPNWLQEPPAQTQRPAQQPAQPRPQTPPPASQAPKPAPAAPAPSAPPVQQPPRPQTPPPAPVTPAPQIPTPTAPVTPPAPPAQAPAAQAAQPAPMQAPATPTQAATPQTPPTTPTPSTPADQPVAFIRAESLDTPKPESGQNPQPQAT